MSFDTLERSIDEGQPIYLYQFNLGSTQTVPPVTSHVWSVGDASSPHASTPEAACALYVAEIHPAGDWEGRVENIPTGSAHGYCNYYRKSDGSFINGAAIQDLGEGAPTPQPTFTPPSWRYTSAQSDREAGGFTWTSIPISDDGIKQTGESTTDALTLTCPIEIGPVQVHMGMPPSTPISIRIWRQDFANAAMIGVYSGSISQVDFPTPGSATITCETTQASMARDGLRLGWQRTCPYAVYDPLTCKVDKTQYAMAAWIQTESNGVVTISLDGATPPDDYLSGGFMEWVHPVRGYETRMIESQIGLTLRIFGQSDDIYPGTAIVVYPGCDQTTATCVSKFNNILNNGGCKDMPGKSPFDGTPVF